MNINSFFSNYMDNNLEFKQKKLNLLEDFREKEAFIKKYDEAVSQFEKLKNSAQLDTFINIKEKINNFLIQFDPNNLESNIQRIENAIMFLEEKELEFKDVSNTLNYIIKTWSAFLNRRNFIERETLFKKEIDDKIVDLEDSFRNAGLDDIGRIEERAGYIKNEITKIISMIDTLYLELELNVFIDFDAISLKTEIENFLNIDILEKNLVDIYSEYDNLHSKIEILKRSSKPKKKAVPVVKIVNKQDKSMYYYTLLFDKTVLEDNYINSDISDIFHTNKFVYFQNYPENGIFSVKQIKEELDISDDQLLAIDEIHKKSWRFFTFFSTLAVSSLIANLLGLIPIQISIALTFLFVLLFTINMNTVVKNAEHKYKVKDLFVFIPVNYYLTKIGDDGLKFKTLVPNILFKFDDIHPQTIKDLLNKKGEQNV